MADITLWKNRAWPCECQLVANLPSMSTSLKLVADKREVGNSDIIKERCCLRGKYAFGYVGLSCQLLCLKSC